MIPTERQKLEGVNLFLRSYFQIIVQQVVYIVAFLFLLPSSFTLSPLISAHSNSSCAMAAQVPLLRAYQLCADCVQVVTLSDGMDRIAIHKF